MTQSFSQSTVNTSNSQNQPPHSTTLHTSASKKRLFVRKPGPINLPLPTEKHRKNHSELLLTAETCRQSSLQDEIRQSEENSEPKTFRMQRHTQNFKKQCLMQSSFSSIKELTASPRRSKVDLLLGLKYIQRPSEQNNGENLNTKNKYPVMRISDLQTEQTINLDDTSDNSLKNELGRTPQTLKMLPRTEDQVEDGSAQRLKILLKGMSYSNLVDKHDELECSMCKNLKKTNQFLSQKCQKLEKQLQLKSGEIRVLCEKVETLKAQKEATSTQESKLREQMYLREMQIYQECSGRYENIRKQLSRALQRVKYLQIENGVLARYKQDCIEAQKDYEKIRLQNDNLKRQISCISRMGHKYNGKKASVQSVKREYGVGKSPYFKLSKQQDTISLELSQASYEHL